MKGYVEGKPFYRANVWVKNGIGDALLREEFTTKREAIACINKFRKTYTENAELDCYVQLCDEYEYCVDSFDV